MVWYGVSELVVSSLPPDVVAGFGIVTASGTAAVCCKLRSSGLKDGNGSGGSTTFVSFEGIDIVPFSRKLSSVAVLTCFDRSSLILLELSVGILLSTDLCCVRLLSKLGTLDVAISKRLGCRGICEVVLPTLR